MKDYTLKTKFKIQIAVAVVALLVVMFGFRLLGKLTDFGYYERQHVVAVEAVKTEINLGKRNREVLLEHVDLAHQQGVAVGESIFWPEKLLMRVIGQGYLLDLANISETDTGETIAYLKTIQSARLSIQEGVKILELMKVPLEKSLEFGKGLRVAAALIKGIVGVLVVFMLGLVIATILLMMRSVVPPLEETAKTLSKIAKGDLSVRIDDPTSGEIGQIQHAMIDMLKGLRNMVKSISASAGDLSQAANDASVITGQTLDGVKEQKAETESLAVSMHDMSAAVERVLESADAANQSAGDGNKASVKGQAIVSDTVGSISLLAGEVERSAEAIQRIEEDSEKIGTVVEMIQTITEQTNLLALNAAIEAARAGEHGRGFAIVANEVRNLAQKTASSTKEIQSMVEGLRAGTDQAVTIMNSSRERAQDSVGKAQQAGDVMEEIAEFISTIMTLNRKISTAAQDQNVVTKKVRSNTDAINDVADKTAAGGQDAARSNVELVNLSQQLEKAVGSFRLG